MQASWGRRSGEKGGGETRSEASSAEVKFVMQDIQCLIGTAVVRRRRAMFQLTDTKSMRPVVALCSGQADLNPQ